MALMQEDPEQLDLLAGAQELFEPVEQSGLFAGAHELFELVGQSDLFAGSQELLVFVGQDDCFAGTQDVGLPHASLDVDTMSFTAGVWHLSFCSTQSMFCCERIFSQQFPIETVATAKTRTSGTVSNLFMTFLPSDFSVLQN